MTKRLVSPPEGWNCGILTEDVRKSGEPRVERLELPLGGAIEYMGQDYVPLGPIAAQLTAGYASDRIVVRVELGCEFEIPCYRCLKETSIAIKGDMRYIFSLRHSEGSEKKRGRSGGGDDGSGEPDGSVDVIEIEPFKSEIDMSQYIWETLILSLPGRVLCRDGCRGLCPICGGDRNVIDCPCQEGGTDPRLEALKGFL